MSFDQNDPTFLIHQESVDHAILEADRHEFFFYDALSFEHPHCDISSSAPTTQKVKSTKCTRGENGKDPTQCRMPGCFQITLKGNGFHINLSPKSTLIWKKRRISFLKKRTELNLV